MALPRLLLIDDEPRLGEYVAQVAQECGFRAEVTTEDHEFRRSFLAECPDMVSIDLGMPGMDGVQLLRFLSDQRYSAPVLIVSGFDRRVLESAFRLGEALGLIMAGPIEKPMRAALLAEEFTRLRVRLAA